MRALLLANDALLLNRIVLPESGISLWITPGGGMEASETPRQALAREVREETGHVCPPSDAIGPVWQRRHHFSLDGEAYDQRETFYLIRTARFEPDHRGNPAAFEADIFEEFRWWPLADIERSNETFVPGALAPHLATLIEHGPPAGCIDVGI